MQPIFGLYLNLFISFRQYSIAQHYKRRLSIFSSTAAQYHQCTLFAKNVNRFDAIYISRILLLLI